MKSCSISTGRVTRQVEVPDSVQERLKADGERHVKAAIARNLEENSRHFAEARDQLDKWAENMELAAQRDLEDVKRQIRERQRRSRQAHTVAEQRAIQEEIVALERKKLTLRKRIFDMEYDIADKRDQLIEALERRMQQKTKVKNLFTIQWKVV